MKRSTCQEIAAHHARLHYLMAEAVVAGLARSIELSHLCRQEVDYYSNLELTEFPDTNQHFPQEALTAFSQGGYNPIQDN